MVFGFGGAVSVIAPVAAAVSCGDEGAELKAIATTGYADSMNKLITDDITVAGGWADARTLAADKTKAGELHAVGVEKARIANDGIQVREGMKAGDQYALQEIFKKLIVDSYAAPAQNAKNPLQIKKNDSDTTEDSLFKVYSHSNYVATSDKVSVLDGDKTKEVDAYPDTANKPMKGTYSLFKEEATNHNIAGYATTAGATIKIVFIPSSDSSYVNKATAALSKYMIDNGVNVDIKVSTDYDTAASQLQSGQIDVAFLPVDTWAKSGKSNFILQAARDLQVATLDFTGTDAKAPAATLANEKDTITWFNKVGQLYAKEITTTELAKTTPLTPNQITFKTILGDATNPLNAQANKAQAFANANAAKLMTGSYESFIYTHAGSKFDKAVVAKNVTEGWKADISTVAADTIYGFTGKTSSASYLFPQIWFHDHFNGFKGF